MHYSLCLILSKTGWLFKYIAKLTPHQYKPGTIDNGASAIADNNLNELSPFDKL